MRILPHLTPAPPSQLLEADGSDGSADLDDADVEGIDKLLGKELFITVGALTAWVCECVCL